VKSGCEGGIRDPGAVDREDRGGGQREKRWVCKVRREEEGVLREDGRSGVDRRQGPGGECLREQRRTGMDRKESGWRGRCVGAEGVERTGDREPRGWARAAKDCMDRGELGWRGSARGGEGMECTGERVFLRNGLWGRGEPP
jgi:hypothetical protein